MLRLYNTRTRTVEPFHPLEEAIRIYVCGPTVYERAHLGNARPAVLADVLRRLLAHLYPGRRIVHVQNFTDVDDKISTRAEETGRDIRDVTDETIAWFWEDMDALGLMRPTHAPRVTDHIGGIVAMIGRLIDRGHAYAAEGHVLFDVASFPDYGALSRRSVEELEAGARIDPAPFKRSPTDFVLWKPSDADQPGWDSPWGRGRPGWHIECSAMAEALLGETFDIHMGGTDIMFPHHENEVAQSRCAHGTEIMANFWVHNAMLNVEGRKMSKSLGNFFTVRDLLDRGVAPEVMRLVLISAQHAKPLDWTDAKVAEAETTLRRWRAEAAAPTAPPPAVVDALCDDLNTPAALAALHAEPDPGRRAAGAELLGLLQPGMGDWAALPQAGEAVAGRISALLDARAAARKAKDFARADALRDGIAAAGVVVTDTPAGPEWTLTPAFDPAKLEGLDA